MEDIKKTMASPTETAPNSQSIPAPDLNKPAPMRKTYALIVKSKTDEPVVAKTVTPLLNSVPISSSRQSRKGEFIIRCDSSADVTRAADTLRNSLPEVDVHLPVSSTIRPKITVVNVASSFTSESPISSIRSKNNFLSNVPVSDLQFLFFTKSRNKSTCAVLSVSPHVRSILKSLHDRIYIELRCCHVFDRFWVTRCGQCSGLGHKTARCDRPTVCGHCAGSHTSSSCPKSTLKCINCYHTGRPYSHSSFSSSCPSFIAVRNSLRARTAVSCDSVPPLLRPQYSDSTSSSAPSATASSTPSPPSSSPN